MTEPKPTIPEVRPLVHALYATNHGAAGGCLHIVLDDGNIEDSNVTWCREHAKAEGCGSIPHRSQPCSVVAPSSTRATRARLND